MREEQSIYERHTPVTLKQTMSFQQSPEDTRIAFTFEVGEEATLTGCDNIAWCEIENEAGKKGWFEVEAFSKIKGTEWYASDVFEGLSYAD